MKIKPILERHLVVNEHRLPHGTEWLHQFRGWCLAYIGKGISYWMGTVGSVEIPAGSTLAFPTEAGGLLRASQLTEVNIIYFYVETGKLLGLLSLREQNFLKQAAGARDLAVRVLPATSAISQHFKNLRLNPGATNSSMRLQLLQLFLDAFDWEVDGAAAPCKTWADGRGRLRQILNQLPVSELVELTVSDLAPMMSCSPRHVNRLFREELGASFREKQVELRLAKACELLITSNAKVVDVALESGYQSSSVFSQLFKKHLGVSPGLWRRQNVKPGVELPLHF